MKHRWTTLLWELWAAQALCAVAALPPGSAFHTCPALALPGLALAAAVPTAWAAWALFAEPPDPLLREAIEQLEPTLRAAVVLYYLEGYDIRETASLLRVPQGTVKSRLSRARRQLQSFLKEDTAL